MRYSQEQTGEACLAIKAGYTGDTHEPMIEVLDKGTGIADDVLDYIFEPFFTTKTSGTGLGLYLAKELCEANRASLAYFARESGGGCFRITFHHFAQAAY